MKFTFYLISGFVVGIEFNWEDDVVVIALGVIRLVIGKDRHLYV